MDNFSYGSATGTQVSSATGEMGSKGVNGVNNLSASSGLNCTPKSGSISSFDERDREFDHGEGKLEVEKIEEHTCASSGNMVPIPQLRTAMDVNRPRQ